MKTYEEIKAELLEIADVLKKFPESIQPQAFEILTKHFLGYSATFPSTNVVNPVKSKKNNRQESEKPKSHTKSTGKSKESYSILKELDLRGAGEISFKDFYKEKNPTSATEFNSVAIYYLVDMLKLESITVNHVYTCYKEVSKRTPEAFLQSLRDTSSKYGYIDTADINNIKLPLRGRNFVEHDLPKKAKS